MDNNDIPRFVARNINPTPGRTDLVSCQIVDRDNDFIGAPCVDVLAITPEMLELWDRIQHEASLYRSLMRMRAAFVSTKPAKLK